MNQKGRAISGPAFTLRPVDVNNKMRLFGTVWEEKV